MNLDRVQNLQRCWDKEIYTKGDPVSTNQGSLWEIPKIIDVCSAPQPLCHEANALSHGHPRLGSSVPDLLLWLVAQAERCPVPGGWRRLNGARGLRLSDESVGFLQIASQTSS